MAGNHWCSSVLPLCRFPVGAEQGAVGAKPNLIPNVLDFLLTTSETCRHRNNPSNNTSSSTAVLVVAISESQGQPSMQR